MTVKEFAEKNAGKKFIMDAPDLRGTEVVTLVGCDKHQVLVQRKDGGHGGRPATMTFAATRENLWFVGIEFLTPINTPSELRKGSKKARKIERAGKVLQKHFTDIKTVATGVSRETGKLQTIVVLQNGAKGIVSKSDDDKFDAYVAVLEARKKALKNYRRFL